MTKEELEKEAEEYRLNLVTKLRPKLQEGCNCKELVDIKKAYLAGAEPREKRIAELEAQIEKMKCCGNCDWKVKGICNDNDNCELEDWKLVETWR